MALFLRLLPKPHMARPVKGVRMSRKPAAEQARAHGLLLHVDALGRGQENLAFGIHHVDGNAPAIGLKGHATAFRRLAGARAEHAARTTIELGSLPTRSLPQADGMRLWPRTLPV